MNNEKVAPCALLFIAFFSPGHAKPLPPCDSWLRSPPPSVTPERLREAGVTLEPGRRMRAEGFQWEHDLRIALPPSYRKTGRAYPVLWVTDSHVYFEFAAGFVTACAHKYVPETIVVGVRAPPEASNEAGVRREYDFTPAGGPYFTGPGGELFMQQEQAYEARLKAEGKPVAKEVGGAPGFLAFLVDRVRPALRQTYRMAPSDALFGDSSGGVFCVYALLAQPDSFDKFICGSPTLYYANHELFHMEERYAQRRHDMPAEVFFGAGEGEVLEERISAWGPVSSMTRMAEILQQRHYPSLKLYVRIFPNETHNSVGPLNLGWGLRTLWQDEYR